MDTERKVIEKQSQSLSLCQDANLLYLTEFATRLHLF